MANSDVKLKQKVQLRKKVEEPETRGEKSGNTPMPPKSNSKKWIVLGIVAVCIICYVIFSKSGNTVATDPTQETEIVEETIVFTDSVSDKGEATEVVLPTTETDLSNNADDQEAKVNDAPATTDNNSNIATPTTSAASLVNVSSDVEAEAMKVIRGDYGVGQERKDKLGTKYQIIQSRVNELKREGIF